MRPMTGFGARSYKNRSIPLRWKHPFSGFAGFAKLEKGTGG
jgi:hypothetical protein